MSSTQQRSAAIKFDHRSFARDHIPFFVILFDHITIHLNEWCRSTTFISGKHMSPSRIHTLRFLEDNPGTQLGAVSAHLGVKNATMSGMINRLEADGYLEKTRDTENLQKIKIYNTKNASTLLEIYHRNLRQCLLGWLGGMSEGDLHELLNALETIAQNLALNERPTRGSNKKSIEICSAKLESILVSIRNKMQAYGLAFFRENSDIALVSHLQIRIINYICTSPGVSQADVADFLGLRTPTIASTIKLMEREDLLIRTAANKGNKFNLSITKKAQKLLLVMHEQTFRFFSLALSNLSSENSEIILKAINCMNVAPSIDQKSAKASIGFVRAGL